MDYRIMFLRNGASHPIGCLAIQIDRKRSVLSYGFSVLNPADKFDRKVARQLALGRLLESPVSIAPIKADANMHEITRSVMKSLIVNRKTPARAVRAAKLWLNFANF